MTDTDLPQNISSPLTAETLEQFIRAMRANVQHSPGRVSIGTTYGDGTTVFTFTVPSDLPEENPEKT